MDVRRTRMEELDFSSDQVDFLTARALGIDNEFLDWSSKSLNPTGSVVLWLGEEDASNISQKTTWKWENPIRIPHSERRIILHGSRR